MNLIRDEPKIFAKISDENISDMTKNLKKFFIEYEYIQKITGFSKKRLDLWLFRHKNEVFTEKYEKQKLISLSILWFLPKMLKNSKRGEWNLTE